MSTQAKVSEISKAIEYEKMRLAHKFAFSLHRGVVIDAKRGVYTRPPRLAVGSCKEEGDGRSSTADGSLGSDCRAMADGDDDGGSGYVMASESRGLKGVVRVLGLYEEYLLVGGLIHEKMIGQAKKFNRALFARVLKFKPEFSTYTGDSLGLAIALRSADSFGLNKLCFLKFVTEVLQNKKVSKISQLKKSRVYYLVSTVDLVQSSLHNSVFNLC